MKKSVADRSKKVSRVLSEALEQRTLFTGAAPTFAAQVQTSVGTAPIAIAAADFNADGDQDIAVADNTTQKVNVFFGTGTGAFTAGPVLALTAPPEAIVVGDFNDDGKPDIAVASAPGSTNTGTTVTVFLNTGAGTFGLGQATTVETGVGTTEPIALAVGDFNADGHLDVATTDNSDGAVSILLGNGNGTFAAPVNYTVGALPTGIAVADLNGDGKLDLIVTDTTTATTLQSDSITLLTGTGDGTFTLGASTGISDTGSSSIVTANLNGDTTPDVVVGNDSATVSLLTNSAATFTLTSMPAVAGGVTQVAVGDFNLDGIEDIVTANGGTSFSAGDDSVTVLPGAGTGTVGTPIDLAVGSAPTGVVVADFNNDGKPDIATVNEGSGTVSVLLNTSTVSKIATTTVLTSSAATVPAESSVVLSATVTPKAVSPLLNEATPTGTVDFFDGTTLIGTAVITPGTAVATLTTTDLIIGSNSLHAVYVGDTGYAGSTTPKITQIVTPTSTEGSDVIGSFVVTGFPTAFVPGEVVTVKLEVTNQGNSIASGVATNASYLSTDGAIDSTAIPIVVKGALAKTTFHLNANATTLLTGTFTVPATLPLGAYQLLTTLDTTGALFESNTTNNLASTAAFPVLNAFGTVGGKANVNFKLNGDTYKLTGPGEGVLTTDTSGIELALTGTTAKSALSITGPATTINSLTADGPLVSIKATATTIGGTLSLPGGVTTLSLASLSGATATIGGTVTNSITVATVANATVQVAGVKSIAVSSWVGGSIAGNWIGTLTSKTDLSASVTLDGTNAPAGVALNSATVKGTVGDTVWKVAGSVNKFSATAVGSGFDADFTGTLKSLATGTLNDTAIAAANFGTIIITGDFDDSTLIAGQNFGVDGLPNTADDTYVTGTITSVRVTESMTGSTIAAGVTPATGGYHVLDGGSIKVITVNGSVDTASKLLAQTLPKVARLGGVAVDPTTDSRFAGL